jgi:hypothetical protein
MVNLAATHQTLQPRLSLDPCETCKSADVGIALQTSYVFYIRCFACGEVRSTPRPGVVQFGEPFESSNIPPISTPIRHPARDE